MRHSSRFFQNTGCEYFPCHQGADPATFNCLFCYCPLYFLNPCGGNWSRSHGLKDCSACLRPHRPEGYDDILTRLRQEAAKDEGERGREDASGGRGDDPPGPLRRKG